MIVLAAAKGKSVAWAKEGRKTPPKDKKGTRLFEKRSMKRISPAISREERVVR